MKSKKSFILKSVFFTLVGALLLFWMVLSVKNGQFTWGSSAGQMSITMEESPVVFWIIITMGSVFSAGVMVGNLSNAIKALKYGRKRSPNRSKTQ